MKDFSISAIKKTRETDGPTDGPTDRRMDRPSYRDAWTHLKTKAVQKTVIPTFLSDSYIPMVFVLAISLHLIHTIEFTRQNCGQKFLGRQAWANFFVITGQVVCGPE